MSVDDLNRPPTEAVLNELLQSLYEAGLPVGVDDAQRLAAVFEKKWDWTPDRIRFVLACLLAKNQEQRRIVEQIGYNFFPDVTGKAGLSAVSAQQSSTASLEPHKPATATEASEEENQTDPPKHPLLIWALIGTALLMAVLGILNLSKPEPAVTLITESEKISEPKPDIPESTPPKAQPQQLPEPKDDLPKTEPEKINSKDPDLRPFPKIPAPPPPEYDPVFVHSAFWLLFVLLLIVFTGLLLAGLYYLFRYVRSSSLSKRYRRLAEGSGLVIFPQLSFGEKANPLPDKALRQCAFYLTAPRQLISSKRWNLRKTLDASIKRLGYLTPVFQHNRQTNPIIFIEDRSHSMVQWPGYADHFYRTLTSQGIPCRRYYTTSDWSKLFTDPALSQPINCGYVRSQCEQATVIVFSAGAGLSPVTGHQDKDFIAWLLNQALWFNPQSPELWDKTIRRHHEHAHLIGLDAASLAKVSLNKQAKKEPLPSARLPLNAAYDEPSAKLQVLRISLGEQGFVLLSRAAIAAEIKVLSVKLLRELCLEYLWRQDNLLIDRILAEESVTLRSDGSLQLEPAIRKALITTFRNEAPQAFAHTLNLLKKEIEKVQTSLSPDDSIAWSSGEAKCLGLDLLDTRSRWSKYKALLRFFWRGNGPWSGEIVSEQCANWWHWWRRFCDQGPIKRWWMVLLLGAVGLLGAIPLYQIYTPGMSIATRTWMPTPLLTSEEPLWLYDSHHKPSTADPVPSLWVKVSPSAKAIEFQAEEFEDRSGMGWKLAYATVRDQIPDLSQPQLVELSLGYTQKADEDRLQVWLVQNSSGAIQLNVATEAGFTLFEPSPASGSLEKLAWRMDSQSLPTDFSVDAYQWLLLTQDGKEVRLDTEDILVSDSDELHYSITLRDRGQPALDKNIACHLWAQPERENLHPLWSDWRQPAILTLQNPTIGMEFLWIPPGNFMMGSPANEEGRENDEGPQHEVELTEGYWLGKYPVTQAQYEKVMGENPSYFKNAGATAPVESVSWKEAVAFCDKLNNLSETSGGPPEGYAYRLPNEAEWEYACRAGTDSAYYDGSNYTEPTGKDPALDKLGWFRENSESTRPVGEKAPNAWGLYDMLGNVWELCSDWYGDYHSDSQVNPSGPDSGSLRVLRGGSWYSTARLCRCAARNGDGPDVRNNSLGFRIVLAPVQTPRPVHISKGISYLPPAPDNPPGRYALLVAAGSHTSEASGQESLAERGEKIFFELSEYMTRPESDGGGGYAGFALLEEASEFESALQQFATAEQNKNNVLFVYWRGLIRTNATNQIELYAGKDAWLSLERVQSVLDGAGTRSVYLLIEGVSDETGRQPTADAVQLSGDFFSTVHLMDSTEYSEGQLPAHVLRGLQSGFAGLRGNPEIDMDELWEYNKKQAEVKSLWANSAAPQNQIAPIVARNSRYRKDPTTGMELLWIPPGRFMMGSPNDEAGRDNNEGPQHEVKLTEGYWLGKYPVTQAQYERVMGENPSHFKSAGATAPVELVSWEEAVAFCGKLNTLSEAAGGQPEGFVYRLPTEAEWEYACRAGTDSAYYDGSNCTEPTGKDPALDKLGWFRENSDNKTHPVGEKQPNDWGLYDVSGNVWEWCLDLYGDYDSGPQINPRGPAGGFFRVLRGGSWRYFARDCRCAARDRCGPDGRAFYIGFRVVLAPVQNLQDRISDQHSSNEQSDRYALLVAAGGHTSEASGQENLAEQGEKKFFELSEYMTRPESDGGRGYAGFAMLEEASEFESALQQFATAEQDKNNVLFVYWRGLIRTNAANQIELYAGKDAWLSLERVQSVLDGAGTRSVYLLIEGVGDETSRQPTADAVQLSEGFFSTVHLMDSTGYSEGRLPAHVLAGLQSGFAGLRGNPKINIDEFWEYNGKQDKVKSLWANSATPQNQIASVVASNPRYRQDPTTGMELLWIPPGMFTMGSPEDEEGRYDNEGPRHLVRLSQSYWIGKYPVTQGQYAKVMGKNPSYFKNAGATAPVENASWRNAVKFCDKLNTLSEAAGGQPEGFVYRLPTEAEWEYACRAGTDSAYYDGSNCTEPTGKDPALDKLGWFRENSDNKTHPVGEKQPNDWGLYDVSGNVWEWCSDWYGDYGSGPQVNPHGPDSGSSRVLRGGSWRYFARDCRCAARDRIEPDARNISVGFRVVLAPVQTLSSQEPVNSK